MARSSAPPRAARGLVLASADSRDDRIVTLLVEGLGRLSAVARHARKSKRRFGGHLDPITLAELELRTRPDWELARLDRARSLEAFPLLKADLARIALATTMAEVVLQVAPEQLDEPELFQLTLRAWRYLDDPHQPPREELLLLFELRALALSGLLPELEELPGLDDPAREALAGWNEGRWAPLDVATRGRVAAVLEGLLRDATGRPLKSRPFLDEVLS